jgi:pyruvate dehydrogenase E2 component (dihydrolipoamide acetyltransferase)
LRIGTPELPPVLMVHGFCGDMLTWQFNIGAVARGHHVIAVDLPDHGRSGSAGGFEGWWAIVDWLEAVIMVLGLERPHLIGHSLGARLLLGLVESGRVEARSLTLIACAGISPSYNHEFLRRLTRVSTLEDALSCARHLFGGSTINLDGFARSLHATLAQPEARAKLARFLDRNVPDARVLTASPIDWSRIACPLQMIWGRDDPVIELPPSDWLPATAENHVLDAVGHMPHVAAADAVNRRLREFLAAAP